MRLGIDEHPLDLDMDALMGVAQHQVRRSQIGLANRNLKRDGPRRVRRRADSLRDRELTGIPERDVARGVQTPTKLVSASSSEPASNIQGDRRITQLGLAHHLLTDSRSSTESLLRQSHGGARDPQILPESFGEVARSGSAKLVRPASKGAHDPMVAKGSYWLITRGLLLAAVHEHR